MTSNPLNIEPVTSETIPYVEDGQIIWKVGWIEYTTTRNRRHAGGFLKVKPNPVGYGQWRELKLDNELYYENFHPLKLTADQRVWWRRAW